MLTKTDLALALNGAGGFPSADACPAIASVHRSGWIRPGRTGWRVRAARVTRWSEGEEGRLWGPP